MPLLCALRGVRILCGCLFLKVFSKPCFGFLDFFDINEEINIDAPFVMPLDVSRVVSERDILGRRIGPVAR
jgi:hypothetical protein